MMKGTRVQIPAYADRWMMGDRHGVIDKVTRHRIGENWQHLPRGYLVGDIIEVAHVKLDKSGRTVAYYLENCEVVS